MRRACASACSHLRESLLSTLQVWKAGAVCLAVVGVLLVSGFQALFGGSGLGSSWLGVVIVLANVTLGAIYWIGSKATVSRLPSVMVCRVFPIAPV